MKFSAPEWLLIVLLAIASLDAFSHTREVDTGKGRATPRSELNCMATALYHESRGESYEGILAVKKVILNRVSDKRWPNTICGVVYQKKQFSFTIGKTPLITEQMAWEGAIRMAKRKTRGTFYGATHYFNPYVVKPRWARKLTLIKRIGNHAFYK